MMHQGGEDSTVILAFTGHYQNDDDYVYVICDQVPLVIPGKDEAEADAAMERAIEMYVAALVERGELEDAIQQYGIEVIPVPKYRPIRWTGRRQPGSGRAFERLVPA